MPNPLKAVCRVGETTQGSLWRQVGRLQYKNNDINKPYLLLDKTFNPAGVSLRGNEDKTAVIISFVPFEDDPAKQAKPQKKPPINSSWDNFEDDIPF